MGPSQDQVLLTFALSWLGVTVVPINTRLGREDMRAVVALADVELLFWDAAHECHASDLKDAGAARSAVVKAAVLTDLAQGGGCDRADWSDRSEEHTSELQSLMRISYAVFCVN